MEEFQVVRAHTFGSRRTVLVYSDFSPSIWNQGYVIERASWNCKRLWIFVWLLIILFFSKAIRRTRPAFVASALRDFVASTTANERITFVLDEEMSGDDECRETLQGITNNDKLSEGYLMLARDTEVMDPKSSEDIYKDKLMTVPSEASSCGSSGNWVFKNKAYGKASAAASLKSVEATAEISKTLNTKIRTHCDTILFSCAYAGTGDVLKVQYLLGQCSQHLKRGETHQGPTVLGIAMVAMAEELGLEMVIRC